MSTYQRVVWTVAVAVLCISTATFSIAADDTMTAPAGKNIFAVTPMIGYDHNELQVHGPRGAVSTESDTALEYGLFAIYANPNFVVNNFTFFSRINESDVWGDLFFANYYAKADVPVTWNVGAGYLYHQINPPGEFIEVKVPMAKAGPVFRVKSMHLFLNPYLGYAWERVSTEHGDQPDDSYLYGLTLNWHWRMIEAGVNYYYQDSQDIADDFNVLRARVNCFVSKNWGLAARVDYMEHQFTKDKSFLVGPIWVF
jgi:hypothetical protein